MALLNIFAPKLPHLFTRLFHIPAVRDITLEHLQLLSNQLLAPPLPGEPWLGAVPGIISSGWDGPESEPGPRQETGGEELALCVAQAFGLVSVNSPGQSR